jgi:hypothetical protein
MNDASLYCSNSVTSNKSQDQDAIWHYEYTPGSCTTAIYTLFLYFKQNGTDTQRMSSETVHPIDCQCVCIYLELSPRGLLLFILHDALG